MDVVWKFGMTRAHGKRGVHAFDKAGGPGSRAVCRSAVSWEGDPLCSSGPRCRGCEARLKEIQIFNLPGIPSNIASYVRSLRLEEARKSHWSVMTHAARKAAANDKAWGCAYRGPHEKAEQKYQRLIQQKKRPRGRGAVQLRSPDGKVEREFIKSPWLKAALERARVADGQHP